MEVRKAADVTVCRTEHSAVVLNERTGECWQLNETGAQILLSMLDGATATQVTERLAALRPVQREQARADVDALLDELARAGLIERG